MGSVNKAIIIGNLGSDVELKRTNGGKAVANMSVATNEKWKDANGEQQERTEWHRVVVWGDQAESCAKYLAKGRQVYLEGRIETRKYEKDGETKCSTEIIANKVVFLGKGDGKSGRDGSEEV